MQVGIRRGSHRLILIDLLLQVVRLQPLREWSVSEEREEIAISPGHLGIVKIIVSISTRNCEIRNYWINRKLTFAASNIQMSIRLVVNCFLTACL